MDKQHRTSFILSIAIIAIIAIVLLLLFIPDMSSTLIHTVPDTPPEMNQVDGTVPEDTSAVTVDRTNAKNIIAAIKRPSEYFSQTQSILHHKSGSATYSRRVWVKGALSRIDIMAQPTQNATMHYVYSADSVYIWRPNSKTFHKAAKGNFTPDDEQMLMTYEDIVSASDEDIAFSEITNYDGVSCIYVEIKKPESGYLEKYWVSYSTGLLIHGETLDSGGALVYSITATHTDISTQSTELFRLPDGTFPT